MKIINYHNQENSIKVKIEINGIELWKYSYMADEPFNNSPKLHKIPIHELGKAINLDRDAHYWKIYLANYNDVNKEVEVSIKWFEQEIEIACWIPEEADDNGKVIVKANAGIEITDSSYFLKS
jgi:hypothetical protein